MAVLCWVPFTTGSLVQSLSHTLAPMAAAFWQQYRKQITKEMTGPTAFMYCQNTVSFTCKITHQSWFVQPTQAGVYRELRDRKILCEKNRWQNFNTLWHQSNSKLPKPLNTTETGSSARAPCQGDGFRNKSETSLKYSSPPCWGSVFHSFCGVLVFKTVSGRGEERKKADQIAAKDRQQEWEPRFSRRRSNLAGVSYSGLL